MNSFYAEMKLLMPAICYRQLAARLEAPTQRGLAAPVGRVADVSETHDATLLLMNGLFSEISIVWSASTEPQRFC